ncbi:MAG TPA: hypothetical protein VNC84_02870 [Gammaproteobacteria bacterium]|jgi:hypothetical protein|nr:hypothetical protein [Gammaproteobacteria bacterium]
MAWVRGRGIEKIEKADQQWLSELLKKSKEEVIITLSRPGEFKQLIRCWPAMKRIREVIGEQAMRDVLSIFLRNPRAVKGWIQESGTEKVDSFILNMAEDYPDYMKSMISHIMSNARIPKTTLGSAFYKKLSRRPCAMKNIIECIFSDSSIFAFCIPDEVIWNALKKAAEDATLLSVNDGLPCEKVQIYRDALPLTHYVHILNPESNLTREQALAEVKRIEIERNMLFHSLRELACLSALSLRPEMSGGVFEISTLCEEIGAIIAGGRLPLPAGEEPTRCRHYCGPVLFAAVAAPSPVIGAELHQPNQKSV